MNILQQDFVTQLDSKPFLSLDANGAQAAWKINRGWNAGTESYLTVMDSTADFVELDDCRVEGGQLTSFTASSTLVQFDKTAYKGAKTLVTIESDDGKVHMLEVTSVCAAAGTNAYATVTNSVTSDNDLVDASIAVVGNNVQVTVTKSSAATSQRVPLALVISARDTLNLANCFNCCASKLPCNISLCNKLFIS